MDIDMDIDIDIDIDIDMDIGISMAFFPFLPALGILEPPLEPPFEPFFNPLDQSTTGFVLSMLVLVPASIPFSSDLRPLRD